MSAQQTPLEAMIAQGKSITFKNVLTKQTFCVSAACQHIFMPYVKAGRLVPLLPSSTGRQESKKDRKRSRCEMEDENEGMELEEQGNLFAPINMNLRRRELTPSKKRKRNQLFPDEDQENAAPASKHLKFIYM